MKKPYVVCHMLMSIDGKVTGEFLNCKKCESAINKYYEINLNYQKDAIALGRVTMEESFTKGYYPSLDKYKGVNIEKKDYVFSNNHHFYMVAFDRKGRLGYHLNVIKDEDPGYDNAMIIEVLTENVDDEYLAYLQDKGVSYVFAGKEDLDLTLALAKLNSLFNINHLLLEGGSLINGAFIRENLVDELSLVVVPLTASCDGKSLFDNGNIVEYKLKEIERYEDGSYWVNYVR